MIFKKDERVLLLKFYITLWRCATLCYRRTVKTFKIYFAVSKGKEEGQKYMFGGVY